MLPQLLNSYGLPNLRLIAILIWLWGMTGVLVVSIASFGGSQSLKYGNQASHLGRMGGFGIQGLLAGETDEAQSKCLTGGRSKKAAFQTQVAANRVVVEEFPLRIGA